MAHRTRFAHVTSESHPAGSRPPPEHTRTASMEENQPEPSRAAGPASWSFRAPLLVAAGFICVISSLNIARLLPAGCPRDSWEATEVMEAWRSLRGLPVYDLSPDGHSTHFYGALVPWVQGEIFRWVGPNNV